MPDRLSALDASFLYLENPATPMHVGEVAIFRKPRTGFDYPRLVSLIEQRLALVPRYRQKVVHIPGRLARPVWVDDPEFDLDYHVRRAALPAPGTDSRLHALVARLMSRQLDISRPLWEVYLVEGLARNRVAIITKSHQAVVDGIGAIEIGQVMLDISPTPRPGIVSPWLPDPEPGTAKLVADAVTEMVRRPGELVDTVRTAAGDVVSSGKKILGAAGSLASALKLVTRPARGGPLNVEIGTHRRFAVARTELDAYRAIRGAHGGTVNDVVLAVVSGALRSWLLSRGEAVTTASTVRALTPISVRTTLDDGEAPIPGSNVSAYLVDLPVGEPNPVVRLHHISHATRVHGESGQLVGARALVAVGGVTPPTLHALGARAAGAFSKRIFNVVVSNVPGPQVPLYAAGAKLLETFPVVPLAENQALSIGVTSYDGGVYFGLNGDFDAMSDLDVLARTVEESLDELRGTVPE